jgi:shikimate dehydrogenase
VAGLVELGLEAITVVGRRPEALSAFAAQCSAWAPQLTTQTLDRSIEPLLAAVDLVVNTTPLGMGTDQSPLSPSQVAVLRPGTTVYDLIYVPRPTQLLRLAAAGGCTTIDGLTMLVHQGAAALRLWSGRSEVPVAAMTAAAEAALRD